MKEILNSVKENTTSRLNNHIIGAYIFSWVLCHLKVFLIFIISSSEEQLDLICSGTLNLATYSEVISSPHNMDR